MIMTNGMKIEMCARKRSKFEEKKNQKIRIEFNENRIFRSSGSSDLFGLW